jgi:hypothetical protein
MPLEPAVTTIDAVAETDLHLTEMSIHLLELLHDESSHRIDTVVRPRAAWVVKGIRLHGPLD